MPWFIAGDMETHSLMCGGLCQTLTNVELAVGLEGGELGLGSVQPPLQQIALRGNCLLEH